MFAKSHHKESNAEVCQNFPAIQQERVSVAQNSFSLLLSYFVAQYVLIIVVQFFCENIF